MRSKITAIVLCFLILICLLPASVLAEKNTDDIIILYENDVHCALEGYSKLASLKKELLNTHEHVGVVSSGDFIQGGSVGTISRGEYIVRVINLVGYDAIALGNHEFDFKLERLNELTDMLNVAPVCCNFERIDEQKPYFQPYSIVEYGDTKIAYIGITTPATVTASSPGQFKNEDGELVFTFHPSDLADTVQKHVDAARAQGADYVIALSHLGDKEPLFNATELIPDICGIDVFLDAHSHSVIESNVCKDKNGADVIVSSTGTEFEHIGKLTISDGVISTELIKTEDRKSTDPDVDACLAEINEEYLELGSRKVAYSEVELITHDEEGNRIVRVGETNLGDFCSDAFRIVYGADIGYMNGGGIRAPIASGDVTLNDLFDVFPYNNYAVKIETTGKAIRDMLELTTSDWPEERGSFPHISGMTFSLNTSIEPSVELDENGMFVSVRGEYRVYNIKVFDPESQKYEPLELEKKYTVAGTNHSLLEGGGGISMFGDAAVLKNDCELDVNILERYITEHLGGTIGAQYASVSQSITFTDGVIEPEDKGDSKEETVSVSEEPESGSDLWIIILCVAAGVAVILVIAVVLKRRFAKKTNQSSKSSAE